MNFISRNRKSIIFAAVNALVLTMSLLVGSWNTFVIGWIAGLQFASTIELFCEWRIYRSIEAAFPTEPTRREHRAAFP
jgi:hypothetical protein